jgi:hypothetical protein
LATRLGVDAEVLALEELAGGAYHVVSFGEEDLGAAAAIVARYRDQEIGVADASLAVLAGRFGTRSLLTLDHRHFSVVRPVQGGRFRLLP